MIDDNTGMLESPDVTHTHTHQPGNPQATLDDLSSYEEEGEEDLEDMASGKEATFGEESGTFGEVPLNTSGHLVRTHSLEEHTPLHERSVPPPPLFLFSGERYSLALLAISDILFCILVGFEGKGIPLADMGVTCSAWLTCLFGVALIVIQISSSFSLLV